MQQGTKSTTYAYDARGNQTQEVRTVSGQTATTTYSYDLADRLISLNTVSGNVTLLTSSFGYNALNQRVTRVENEVITHFYYTGGALLFSTENEYLLKTQNILDPSGGIVASKRFEGQEQTGQDPFANEYFFYRYGIRGSVTSIVHGTGTRIKGYDYDEFGNATASSSAFHNDVTFTGSISDASGLLYMNAWYYNPQTARFLSQDTYKGVASSPWTQHLYSYCNNNPVNMIDPTGHKALPCLKDFWEWLTGGGNCGGKEAPTPEPSSTPKPITIEVTVAPSTPGPAAPTVPSDQVDTWERMRLRKIAEGLDNEAAKRILLNASEMTHKQYGDGFDCLTFVCDAYAGTDFDAKFRDRSTSGIYTDLSQGKTRVSGLLPNFVDRPSNVSGAEEGAVLFFSCPDCTCGRCTNHRYIGNVHHVGIYIGIINGKEMMVDNGTYGVTIRGVDEIERDSHGDYFLIAYLNPGGA